MFSQFLATIKVNIVDKMMQSAYLCVLSSGRIFENIPQNGPEYSHRNMVIARFLVTAVRKKHRGLAVLVGLIVKLSR